MIDNSANNDARKIEVGSPNCREGNEKNNVGFVGLFKLLARKDVLAFEKKPNDREYNN